MIVFRANGGVGILTGSGKGEGGGHRLFWEQEQQCEFTNEHGSDFQDSVNTEGVYLRHNCGLGYEQNICLQQE